jgi:hypothetical protein
MEKNVNISIKIKKGGDLMNKNLKKIIGERGMDIKGLARLTGIKELVLRCKIFGIWQFNACEILRVCDALALDGKDIEKIFFE